MTTRSTTRLLGGLVALLLIAGCGGSVTGDLPRIVDAWRERSGAPAVVVSTLGPDGLRTAASGSPERGGDPVTPGSPFRVASVTKLFVATVVLQLAEEGVIGLDDPLARFVPGFPRADAITLRQLLHHTSGVPDHSQIEGFGRQLLADRDRTWSTGEVLALSANRTPEFAPGTDHAYSNTGYVLLGEVIRAATGTSWAAQVRARILDPLGMTGTYVAGSEPGPPVVAGWSDVDGDGTAENVETGRPWPALESSEGAAGAVVSTAQDLTTFGDALFHGRLLGPATMAEMTRGTPFRTRFADHGLGLEIRRTDYRTTTWGHGGALPGFRSALQYLPDRDLLVVVLVDDGAADAADLAELVHRAAGTG